MKACKFMFLRSQINVKKDDKIFSEGLTSSFFLFYLWTIFYGILVFQQFETSKVVFLSVVFSLFLIILVYVFNKNMLNYQFKLKSEVFIIALSIFLIMVVNSNSGEFWSKIHFPVYPLLQLDTYSEINRDSLYHASLTQSILNFGYPSIAQHDVPLILYHMLSYYVNAAIIKISNVEVFDSYGLFFYFETFIFVSAVIIFLRAATKELPEYVSFLSFLFLTPLIITWLAIGSMPLWVPSLLLVLSAPKVFSVLMKDKLTFFDLLFLFFLVCIIALGKVSSGFMYGVFLGFFLVLKHYRNIFIYMLGVAWCVFFWLYYSYWLGGAMQEGMQVPSVTKLLDFIYLLWGGSSLYVLLLLFGMFLFLFKRIFLLYFFLASLFSIIVLVVVVQVVGNFGKSDIGYFVYGLHWVLVLFLIQAFFEGLRGSEIFNGGVVKIFSKKMDDNILIFVSSCTVLFFAFNFNNIAHRVASVNLQPFYQINKFLPSDKKLSLTKLVLEGKVDYLTYFKSENELRAFRGHIYDFMAANDINKRDSLLYIPEETFERELNKFQVDSYFRGFMVYAVVGVPLIYGLKKIRGGYGHADYTNEAKWKERNEFDEKEACAFNKNIIVVESWKPLMLSLNKCK